VLLSLRSMGALLPALPHHYTQGRPISLPNVVVSVDCPPYEIFDYLLL